MATCETDACMTERQCVHFYCLCKYPKDSIVMKIRGYCHNLHRCSSMSLAVPLSFCGTGSVKKSGGRLVPQTSALVETARDRGAPRRDTSKQSGRRRAAFVFLCYWQYIVHTLTVQPWADDRECEADADVRKPLDGK